MSQWSRRKALEGMGAAAVTLGLAGCAGEDDDGTDDGAGDGDGMEDGDDTGDGDDDPIPLASFAPVTGAGSTLGPGHQAGFNAAVEDLNEAGGPLGRQIEPFNRDTETAPERAAEKLNTIIAEEGIEAFVGAWSSGVSTTLAPIAADNEVMEVSHGSTSPVLADMGYREVDGEELKFFGRCSPNDAQQGIVMALALDELVEAESAAFMHVDNPYGAGLAEKAAEAFQGEVTEVLGYAQETSDYSGALEQAFADDPDAFGLIAYPANGQAILEQWSRGGHGGDLVLSESMDAPQTLQELTDIVEGSHLVTMTPERDVSYQHFETRVSEDELVVFAAHAYDAAVLISFAMHQAGEESGVAVARNIRELTGPPGEQIQSGPDEFERAFDLLDDGEDINYMGASSPLDLNEFLEPLNRFTIYEFGSELERNALREVDPDFFDPDILYE